MKLLAIISLTAFLCCGVQSSGSSERELKERIINSGIAVFIDFLDKVKSATEKIVEDERFKKSRIVIQERLKEVKQITKQIFDVAKDDSQRIKQKTLAFSAVLRSGTMAKEIADNFFHPFMNIYRDTLKTETRAAIWREVESEYLQGAPPVHDKPMGFLSYLLAKLVVRSGLLNALKGGVNITLEVGKLDLDQLHEDAQMFMNNVREKAAEISALERQKETNDFLASLRTASGLTVYYWDQLLEHTESRSFHEKYYDSIKRWRELTKLRNAREKYNVLINPETKDAFLNWFDQTFDIFSEAMALKYYTVGNEVFGSDRFNQSNWSILKIATVHGLPVYEKLTESGFGISELNSLLNRVDLAIQILDRNDVYISRQMLLGHLATMITYIAQKEKAKGIDDGTLLPFKVIKNIGLEVWDSFQSLSHMYIDSSEFQRTEREWNHARTIIINELIKSGEFTEEQLEEAKMNFIHGIRGTIEKVMKFADVAEGLDKRIEWSILIIKKLMHHIMFIFLENWNELLE